MSKSDWERIFTALHDRLRRRLLIALLKQESHSGRIIVPEEIHEGEKELDELQVELFHEHLPLLEDANFINWDRNTHEVATGSDFSHIRPVLELLHNSQENLPDGWV